jgi:hypothetical protein
MEEEDPEEIRGEKKNLNLQVRDKIKTYIAKIKTGSFTHK